MEKIKEILFSVFNFTKRYKYTILTLFYFCLIVSLPAGMRLRLLPTIGCLSIVLILHIIANIKFSYVFAVILAILVTLNAYVAFMYSGYVSTNIVAVLFETNADEIKSTLGGLFFPVLSLLIISIFLIVSSVKELKRTKLKIKDSVLLLLVYIGFLTAATFRQILIFTDLRVEYPKSPLDTFSKALNYYSPLLYGNIATFTSYFYDIYLFNEYIDAEKQMPEGISLAWDKQAITKIFLVIGESANYEHLSLFGYDQPTTPFVDSLSYLSDSLTFYRGRAIASQTKNAVPGLLSCNTPKDVKCYRNTYSVIELAKKNGYVTYWISNQNTSGIWNGRDAISTIAGQSDFAHFWDGDELLDDFTLLPSIEEHYDDSDKKQLFIIHLQGSHFAYKDRYDDLDIKQLPGEASLLMHYDRSIHHTDRMLKKLYQLVKRNNSSAMIYVSDHGQEIQEMFGHGVGKPTKKQFDTPIIVFNYSPFPLDSICSKYLASDSIISNNSASAILSEAIGYSVDSVAIRQSVADGEFVLHGDDKVYRYEDLE